MDDILHRHSAADTVCQGFHHAVSALQVRYGNALYLLAQRSEAIVLVNDDVVGYVYKPPRQVARVRRPQSRVCKALPRAV